MRGTESDEVARRRATGVGRKIKLREDDGSFDMEFWDRYTPSERVMMVWQMVVEEHAAQGRDPAELRFQRSAGGLQSRRR
jgi:D-alanyl-D-alanine dipeptidase